MISNLDWFKGKYRNGKIELTLKISMWTDA